MVKVAIDREEAYPVYSLEMLKRQKPDWPHHKTIEIDAKIFRRWNRAIKEYENVQKEIENVFESS